MNRVSDATKVVALGQTHWADGQFVNINKLGPWLKGKGIIFVIDGIQSVGIIPTDVKAAEVDFLACGMYKWLLGPYGLGFLYVDEKYHEGPSLDATWMSRLGAEDFTQLTHYRDEFLEGAARFSMGGKSSFIHVEMAIVALEWVISQGVERLSQLIWQKTDLLAQFFTELGYPIIAPTLRAPHILSVQQKEGASWSEKQVQFLLENKIYVSFRGNFLRISPHVYNTEKDISYFMDLCLEGIL
ncbi:MAG: aminotransferase class V-fold PLP-dependent enzyme, partial [Bdellovibrionales bacterium]|nr:aminotransferase class V-fold PLP-dependent enzyme [Bdellovibrionales bacterium]